jgi:Fe-S-cluster containining protein
VDEWNFDCNKCGACCKVIGCPYLTDDNMCSVYDKRPFLCDTKKMFDAVHSKTMTKQEYFNKAKIACNQLKELYDD